MKRVNTKTNSSVKLCRQNICLEANGKYAQIITDALTVMIILFGVSALLKAVK